MKAIQSVVYAFSGINIFAEATASSMEKIVSPSMDLSQIEDTPNKIIDLIKTGNWYEIGAIIAQKLNEGMASIPWDQIQTGAKSIATGITGVLNGFFENLDWSVVGQNLSEGIKGIFSGISSFLNEIDWEMIGEDIKTFVQNIDWVGIWGAIKETVKSAIGSVDGILTGLFGEGTATLIEAIALAIGAVTLATTLYSIAKSNETAILWANAAAWIAMNWPIILITVAIAALIAIIILIARHWEEVSAVLSAGWEWIKQKAEEIFSAIGEFFENIWKGICNTATTIWNNICNFFKEIWDWILQTITGVLNGISTIWNNIWNGISSFISNIWNGIVSIVTNTINNIKTTISNVLNLIKDVWNNIWNGLKTIVINIFDGIWNAIKGVINSILGGIERMANGVINGVNFVIRALNKLKFDIPDWIPGLGGKTFGFNIGLIPQVSLPRLAKGNVAYSPLIALFGEYSGASYNPEITAPQNVLRETFEDVLSNREWNSNNSGRAMNLTVYVGNKKIGEILLEELSNMRRQNGKGLEVYCS